jgi:hypothetical protein
LLLSEFVRFAERLSLLGWASSTGGEPSPEDGTEVVGLWDEDIFCVSTAWECGVSELAFELDGETRPWGWLTDFVVGSVAPVYLRLG